MRCSRAIGLGERPRPVLRRDRVIPSVLVRKARSAYCCPCSRACSAPREAERGRRRHRKHGQTCLFFPPSFFLFFLPSFSQTWHGIAFVALWRSPSREPVFTFFFAGHGPSNFAATLFLSVHAPICRGLTLGFFSNELIHAESEPVDVFSTCAIPPCQLPHCLPHCC